MQIIESTSKRLLREMGVLKNKIESINAQIQACGKEKSTWTIHGKKGRIRDA